MREHKYRALDTETGQMIQDSPISMASIMRDRVRKAIDGNGKRLGMQYKITEALGICDRNGVEVYEGARVRIIIEGCTYPEEWQTLFEGVIEYHGKDNSSLGCGYGVRHNERFDYLASFSNTCEIEVIE